jgi:hypothetical protein
MWFSRSRKAGVARSSGRSFRPSLESLEQRAVPTVNSLPLTINPTLSSITVSGTGLGVPIDPQGPGSLTTTYSGTIMTLFDDSGNGAIQFLGASVVAGISGNWKPSVGGADLTPAPANYGGQVLDSAYAATRDFAFTISTNGFLPLDSNGNFDPTQQQLDPTGGSVDYNAGLLGHGNVSITAIGPNQATTQGTLTNNGGTSFHLVVPIMFSLDSSSPPAHFKYAGSIVADANLPVLTLGNGTRDFSTTFTTGGPAVNIADTNNATIFGTASQTLTSLSITLTNYIDGLNEFLSVDLSGTPNLAANWMDNGNGTATLTISGTDSVADYTAAIRGVQYNNTSATPDPTTRMFQWTATDDQGNTGDTSFSTVSIQ